MNSQNKENEIKWDAVYILSICRLNIAVEKDTLEAYTIRRKKEKLPNHHHITWLDHRLHVAKDWAKVFRRKWPHKKSDYS